MSRAKLLIVDDDTTYASRLARALDGIFNVETCNTVAEFQKLFAVGRYDLLIIDMRLDKDREGLALLREALIADPLQAAIVMTAYADIETYTDALASGAMTYLDKSEFSPTLIARTVEAILEQAQMRRRVSALEGRLETIESIEIIGASPAIRKMREELRGATETDTAVMLVGEPGAGKEMTARNIHRLSRQRSEGPFVRVSCRHLRRDDLFHNLFASANVSTKYSSSKTKSWLEEARRGVLFLDGISGLDTSIRKKLPNLIDSLVSTRSSGVYGDMDVRLMIASEPGAEHAMRSVFGKTDFVRIAVPSLREHSEDIALIAQYTLQHMYRNGRTLARSLRGAALSLLESQPWPGNVRELKSAIEYAAIRADATGEREIGQEHLPFGIISLPVNLRSAVPPAMDYQHNLARSELALVESAIETFGTMKKTALSKRLGYNDRYIFVRRVRKNLDTYQTLRTEFPKTAKMVDGQGKKSL